MIPIIRPFQEDLYHRVCVTRRAGHRIIVVQAATGAGKTVWGSYVTKQATLKETPTLWLVHRRRLVDQISATLYDFQIDHGIIMRGQMRDPKVNVQVASRDTFISRGFNNDWIELPPAGLIFVDEAHHAADPQSEYRRILERYPSATIILLTATPVGPDGKGLGPWAQAIECAAPTSELIRQGYLVPLKCYAPDRKMRGGKAKRGVAGDLVASWQDYSENMPTVLFCSRVKHSIDAVEAFKEAGIPAAHVDADTPDDVRDEIFDGMVSGKYKVVSNVGIIGEGVDVPALGCCQLFCEVDSRVRLMQATGRIMRPYEGKTHGVLIDHSGAVFRHGFPDEDMEWTLEGNADEAFAKKHKDGETAKACFCKNCELVYHGQLACPQCGSQPSKPPKSIFAPQMKTSNEILTEAERGGPLDHWEKDQRVKHWFRCLATAANKNGTFGMASVIYKRKYNQWPDRDFPCMPGYHQWKMAVTALYPTFGKKRKVAT